MNLHLTLTFALIALLTLCRAQKPGQLGNDDSGFNPDPLAGLPGAENEKPEVLPPLNRVKKVTKSPISRNLRTGRQQQQEFYGQNERFWAQQPADPRPAYLPEQQPVNYDPIQKIVDDPFLREKVERKRLRHKRDADADDFGDGGENFNSGIQFRAYGGGEDAGTGRSAGPEPRRTPAPKKSGPTSTAKPAELAPQIDENFVSTLFKHPEAVKFVYDYLEKEKAFTTTTTTATTARTTKRTTTKVPKAAKPSVTPPPKPISANQAKINRLNSLFGLALLATDPNNGNNNSNDGGSNNNNKRNEGQTKKAENKRPEKIPSLASLFGSVDKSDIKKKSEIPSLSSIFSAIEKLPQRPPERVDNPLVNGEKKPDLQFFGPSDFVPKSKYSLPIHTNGPMRLKYVSAKDFPFNTPFGIVPIPR